MNRTSIAKSGKKRLPQNFQDLCVYHPPRPIRDDVDLDNTQEVVDALLMVPKLNRDQQEYLGTLATLIEVYEAEYYQIGGNTTPLEALKFLMTSRKLNAADLGRVLGNRSLGSAILRGERAISKAAAVKLAQYFKVAAALFLPR